MKSKSEILKNSKNIAVVGMSDKPFRVSREIAVFLKDHGYNVAGVNPLARSEEVDGIRIYKTLKDVPFEIDIVNVFRKSETIGDIIPDVLEVKPGTLWLQLGIRNDEAVKPAEDAGMDVVQDACIMVEYTHCN
ncbi:MAG: CoA-binding protein [Syntrophothermus sp.]